MSWPLKYRPRTFDELALKDVREQLKKLLTSSDAPQVFLFAGPKGSGKTSTSRIISAFLNSDLDDTEKDRIFSGSSFVVQEMDAASNRGIDDIRSLKERAMMPPQLGKKAVYILDEAHMLTKEAFNALLKLLEEPPEHAVFILATTELHKVPDTILSRSNLIRFRQATDLELGEVLSKILTKEKVEFEPDALSQVIRRADGSFRDAVKLLEMVCRGEKKLTGASLAVLGSLTLKQDLIDLVKAVVAKDEQTVIKLFASLREHGEDEKHFTKELLKFLHEDLLVGLGAKPGQANFSSKIDLFFLDQLSALNTLGGYIPFLNLEVRLLDLIFKAKDRISGTSSGGGSHSKEQLAVKSTAVGVKKNPPKQTEARNNSHEIELIASTDLTDIVATNNISPSPLKSFISDNLIEPSDEEIVGLSHVWSEFLKAVEEKNLTLAAIIKSAKLLPEQSGVTRIGVYYSFHKLQLEQQKQLNVLLNCGQEVTGGRPKFEFVLIESGRPTDQVKPVASTTNMPAGSATNTATGTVINNLESIVSEALL